MDVARWDRPFRLWHYTFSYSQLLLRSAPRNDTDRRVDVLFSNVCYIAVPAHLSELSIEERQLSELREGIVTESDSPYTAFRLNEGLGWVCATQCQWHEDDGWLDGPSHFGPPRSVK